MRAVIGEANARGASSLRGQASFAVGSSRPARSFLHRKFVPVFCFFIMAVALSLWRWRSLVNSHSSFGSVDREMLRNEVGGKSSQANDAAKLLIDDDSITRDRVLFVVEGRKHFQQPTVEAGTPTSKPAASTAPGTGGSRRNDLAEPPSALTWNRSIYLPVDSDVSLEAFRKYDLKQRKRAAKFPNVTFLKWGDPKQLNATNCLLETPECEFFMNISCPSTFLKCCAEHLKLKRTLFYVLDIAERHHLQLFLDSGTLLSSWRDGGDTLVPWETDIDLGIVGNAAGQVADVMMREDKVARRRISLRAGVDDASLSNFVHYFEPCSTVEAQQRAQRKREAKSSGGGVVDEGHMTDAAVVEHCNDAHYVYFQPNASLAKVDTCRVEIWPFGSSPGDAFLTHPTRSHLNVPAEVVLPLSTHGGRCRMWGRVCMCPRDPEKYLDQWYPDHNWRFPQTIHWNENNAPAWRS